MYAPFCWCQVEPKAIWGIFCIIVIFYLYLYSGCFISCYIWHLTDYRFLFFSFLWGAWKYGIHWNYFSILIYGEVFLLDSIFKMSWKVVLIGRIIDLTLCTLKNVIIHNELCSYPLCQRPCYPYTLEMQSPRYNLWSALHFEESY